jgi:hypothetical protein
MKKGDKIANSYKDLIKFANFLGLSVHHEPRKYILGSLDLYNRKITISSAVKATLEGCFILAHEIGHYIDFITGKYRGFFYITKRTLLEDNKRNRKLIEDAEWSAITFAKSCLRQKRVPFRKLEYTQRAFFKANLPDWQRRYFRSK